MLRRYGSIVATVAVGMLAGGVFGAGCGTGGGEVCVTDADCTVGGETCIAGATGVSQCGCDPTAATDSCTAADSTTICHPDRAACELSCETDEDCVASGEVCDLTTNACRDPGSLGCTTDFDCTAPDVCDTEASTCVAPCTDTSCTEGQNCNAGTKLCEPDCTVAGNECAEGSTCDTTAGVCVQECGGNVCSETQVCDTTVDECVERCVGSLDCDVGADEVCDTATGLCQVSCDALGGPTCTAPDVCNPATGLCGAGCSGDIECTGDDRCIDSACEAPVDISECSETDREFVDFETNACTPTAGNLDACDAADERDPGNAESAEGPTIFDAVSVSRAESSANCGSGPEVTFFVRYFDAEGDVATFSGGVGAISGDLLQSVAGDESNAFASSQIQICGTDTSDGVCAGESSDATSGSFLFTICRPTTATEEVVAVYLKDTANNWGNSVCIEIKPEHL